MTDERLRREIKASGELVEGFKKIIYEETMAKKEAIMQSQEKYEEIENGLRDIREDRIETMALAILEILVGIGERMMPDQSGKTN